MRSPYLAGLLTGAAERTRPRRAVERGSARALLGASWLAVRRTMMPALCAVAVALVVLTWPWQADGRAVDVMHGLAILLACAWAGCTDDPAGEVAAASPYPVRTRVLARLAAGLALVLPVCLAGAVVADQRFAPAPMTTLLVEGAGDGVAAVALGTALRAWWHHFSPSYLASIGLLGMALVSYVLPRGWTMVGPQPWGPPLEAALIRWAALILLGIAVLGDTLRDSTGDVPRLRSRDRKHRNGGP